MKKEIKVLAWPAFNYKPFNPYNWLLNKNLERLGVHIIPFTPIKTFYKSYDIWHMHWPAENVIKDNIIESLVRFVIFFLLMVVAKAKGATIFWTAHNHKLHDQKHPKIERIFWNLFHFSVDATISHSNFARNKLLQDKPEFKKKENYVIYHGHYKSWYENNISESEARQSFGLSQDEFVFLFTGNIRPYKNVHYLIDLFKKRKISAEKLIIGGKTSSKEMLESIQESIINNDNILFFPGWIEDSDFQLFFNAADLAILPYQILNSGMALLSLSFDCPVLMPSNPMLNEYQDIIGKDLLYLYDEELNNNLLDKAKNNIKKNNSMENHINELDWSNIAEKTLNVYLEMT